IDWVIHDLLDDHGPDARTGVRRVERGRNLRDEMLIAGADDVASKGHARGRAAENETVAVAGEIAARVAGEQIDLLATRAQREAPSVGCDRPAPGVLVVEGKNPSAQRVRQSDLFATIVELAGIEAVNDEAGILVGERRRVAAQHEELPRREHGAVGEGENDSL